ARPHGVRGLPRARAAGRRRHERRLRQRRRRHRRHPYQYNPGSRPLMPVTFRLLTEDDVKTVLSMDDLVETMASALGRFSAGGAPRPARTIMPAGSEGLAGFMPACVPAESLGAKIVTVFDGNHARGLPSHLASIVLMDPETGALLALLDGRYITEARTAAV